MNLVEDISIHDIVSCFPVVIVMPKKGIEFSSIGKIAFSLDAEIFRPIPSVSVSIIVRLFDKPGVSR